MSPAFREPLAAPATDPEELGATANSNSNVKTPNITLPPRLPGLDIAQWMTAIKIKYFDRKMEEGARREEERISGGQVVWKGDLFVTMPEWEIHNRRLASGTCAHYTAPFTDHLSFSAFSVTLIQRVACALLQSPAPQILKEHASVAWPRAEVRERPSRRSQASPRASGWCSSGSRAFKVYHATVPYAPASGAPAGRQQCGQGSVSERHNIYGANKRSLYGHTSHWAV